MTTVSRQDRSELEQRVLSGLIAVPHEVLRLVGPAWGIDLFTHRRAEAVAILEHGPDLDAINAALAAAGSESVIPPPDPVGLSTLRGDVQTLIDIRTQERDEKAGKPRGFVLADRWCSFTAADLAEEPPKKQFIWQDRVPLGDVGSLSASGGSCKTALIVGLAVHRAVDRPFLGRAVMQGSTVIVSTEDGRDDYHRKLAAWRSVMVDLDLDAVSRHVHLIDLAGIPFRLIKSDFGDYIPTAHVEALAAQIMAKDPGTDLIVIETVSRVGGDEGNAAMSALVCAAEQLSQLTGASVLLVAHVSKAAGREKNGDAYAARGGSALGDNGRFSLTLAGLADEQQEQLLGGIQISPEAARDLLVFRVPKINAAPGQDPVVLQKIGTRYGPTLREYGGEGFNSVEEARTATRASLGHSLRTLAASYSRLGEHLTESKLTGGLFKDVPGLRKNRIPAVVLAAIEDGFLLRGPTGRGGGRGSLLPNFTGAEEVPGELAGELARGVEKCV
jgi:hypothetical protein